MHCRYTPLIFTQSTKLFRSLWPVQGKGVHPTPALQNLEHKSSSLAYQLLAHQFTSFTRCVLAPSTTTMKTHIKARCEQYPGSSVTRSPVPDDKVCWEQAFEDYKPVDYTADVVNSRPVWADVPKEELESNPIKFNGLDGIINRRSHLGDYSIVDSVPRNPIGRTGVIGRGLLGRWGPNHAADPIVTRWKKDRKGRTVMKNDKPVLQFIAVQRRDNGQWAIPGGMVNAGEVVTITIKREFAEESMNSLEASPEEKKAIEAAVDELFAKGVEVYRGYVDDPRNTDNAWMETVAMNFHDNDGTSVSKFNLHAGDDAVGVKWIDLSRDLELFASHVEFLHTTAGKHNANW